MSETSNPASKLALRSDQSYIRDELLAICRAILARPDQSSHSLLLGAIFTRAAECLPYSVCEITISVRREMDYESSSAVITLTLGEGEISIEVFEIVKGEWGSDHETFPKWRVNEKVQRGLDDDELTSLLHDLWTAAKDPDSTIHFYSDYDLQLPILECDDCGDWDNAFSEEP